MITEFIELQTADSPDAVIIWLHGLGADGHDFEAIVPELRLPAELAIRFIFPHAPYRPITLNNGYVMRGWYDIKSLSFGSEEDAEGIDDSATSLNQLIEQQVAQGIKPERILLAGFSQGGAIILHTGLNCPWPLGGLMVLSSYLPLADQQQAEIRPDLNLFMAHGLQDEIVSYQHGVNSRLWLESKGVNVEWHDYPMGHSVCAEEVEHIRDWIIRSLG